jgi:hypothetical protein
VIVSINQPAYLPWLGYFDRIAASDVHVVLDHVQFEKGSFVNRNRVRTPDGSTWLSVPVRTKGRFRELPIASLEIDESAGWRRKHWQTLRQAYGRAPHFAEHEQFFAGVYARDWPRLAPLCEQLTGYLLQAFGIDTPLARSFQLAPHGAKDELVLDLCATTGATTYLSGPLGRDYLRESIFSERGIRVVYQDYAHPVYPQLHEPFEPLMAAVDLLFNAGDSARELFAGARARAAA